MIKNTVIGAIVKSGVHPSRPYPVNDPLPLPAMESEAKAGSPR